LKNKSTAINLSYNAGRQVGTDGYQPAPKWLKDRKDCHLKFDDILHYQKIIVA